MVTMLASLGESIVLSEALGLSVPDLLEIMYVCAAPFALRAVVLVDGFFFPMLTPEACFLHLIAKLNGFG